MQELTEFNIEKITAEIIILRNQTGSNFIEMGKRFLIARDNLEHGEFLNWLENKVDFSQRTAYNLMKVAETFSNLQPVANLGMRKLLALAGLEEDDRQEVMTENNVEKMTTRELEQAAKEKKEIKRQLKAEQEYSEELQEAIKQKEEQIRNLQKEIENIQVPEKEIIEKEIVKEVVPERLILEKTAMEEELKTLKQRAEKAESALKSVKLETNLEKDNLYYENNLDLLLVNVKDFLDRASKYTYFKEEYQKIPTQKRKFIEKSVASVKDWVMLMEQALENREDMIGNIIYGEGEIINE